MRYELIGENVREIVSEREKEKLEFYSELVRKDKKEDLKELSVRDIFDIVVYNALMIEYYNKKTVEHMIREGSNINKYAIEKRLHIKAMIMAENAFADIIEIIEDKYGMNIYQDAREYVKAKSSSRSLRNNDLKCKGIIAKMDALEVEIEFDEGKI